MNDRISEFSRRLQHHSQGRHDEPRNDCPACVVVASTEYLAPTEIASRFGKITANAVEKEARAAFIAGAEWSAKHHGLLFRIRNMVDFTESTAKAKAATFGHIKILLEENQ